MADETQQRKVVSSRALIERIRRELGSIHEKIVAHRYRAAIDGTPAVTVALAYGLFQTLVLALVALVSFSPCCTPGGRICSIIPTYIVSSRVAESRPMAPGGFLAAPVSSCPSGCCPACSADCS